MEALRNWTVPCLILLAILPTAAYGTTFGYINYAEGAAQFNAHPLSDHSIPFPLSSEGDLITASGRVEFLLEPGVFVRIGQTTTVHIASRLDLLKGEITISFLKAKDESFVVGVQGCEITLLGRGFYEVFSHPIAVKVFQGGAKVKCQTAIIEATARKEVLVDDQGHIGLSSFDEMVVDSLYAWSSLAAEHEAMCSYGIALTISSRVLNQWYTNSPLQCLAFVPVNGTMADYFGWGFSAPSAELQLPIVTTPHFRYPARIGLSNSPRLLPTPFPQGTFNIKRLPRVKAPYNQTIPLGGVNPPSPATITPH